MPRVTTTLTAGALGAMDITGCACAAVAEVQDGVGGRRGKGGGRDRGARRAQAAEEADEHEVQLASPEGACSCVQSS